MRAKGRIPYGKKQTNERRAAAKTLKALYPCETREEIDRVLWSAHMANPKRTRRQLVRWGIRLFLECPNFKKPRSLGGTRSRWRRSR